MFQMTKSIQGTGKEIIMDISFCVMEGLILMIEKGVLGLALLKKQL